MPVKDEYLCQGVYLIRFLQQVPSHISLDKALSYQAIVAEGTRVFGVEGRRIPASIIEFGAFFGRRMNGIIVGSVWK
jgi:hypothetical protein